MCRQCSVMCTVDIGFGLLPCWAWCVVTKGDAKTKVETVYTAPSLLTNAWPPSRGLGSRPYNLSLLLYHQCNATTGDTLTSRLSHSIPLLRYGVGVFSFYSTQTLKICSFVLYLLLYTLQVYTKKLTSHRY